MSIQNNLKRAIYNQNKWAKGGSRATAKYNITHGTNFIHDVSIVSPYINNAGIETQIKLISNTGVDLLKEDVSSIPRKDNYTSFSSFYTYVLTMTERKFGKDSVRKDISNDPHGFRGFKADPEVIEFVQNLVKITLRLYNTYID
jgi:hypothetical protein